MRPWEQSRNRTLQGGWVRPADLPRGPHGRALCRWCRMEVPPGRRSFCSDWCVQEWRLRSDPGYLRDHVFARDRGVCALCGVDTVAALRDLKRSRGAARQRMLAWWGLRRIHRGSLWDADHIVAVAEGGGECDPANIRTLCLRCHRQATAELRRRLAGRSAGDPARPAERNRTP